MEGSRPRDWNDLHWAIWTQDLDQVKAILAGKECSRLLGDDDTLGWTPLHLACTSHRSECFSTDQGAFRHGALDSSFARRSEANLKHPQYAYTYSRYAGGGDPEEVLSFFILLDLLHGGADTGARTKNHLAALHLAASSGWIDHMKALRYWGASIHDAQGLSPALYAAGSAQGYLMAKLGPNTWRRLQKDGERGSRLPDFCHDAAAADASSDDMPFTLPGTFDSVQQDTTFPSCRACRSISLESLQSVEGHRHTSFSDLEMASRTCSLCSFLFHLLSRLRRPTAEEGCSLVVLRSRAGTIWNAAQALQIQLVNVDEVSKVPFVMESIFVDMFTSDYGASVSNKIPFGRLPRPDTRGEKALNICSGWLQQCERDHDCGTNMSNAPVDISNTPERLLNVSECITTGTVQFVPGYTGLGNRYVALSHRWVAGALPPWVTTLSNLKQRTAPEAFHVSQLPATIQDAIFLTHNLGIKYVWIDSLCIVQDSEANWRAESVKMSAVFGHASLTIFSECAMDDNEPFLGERTASSFQRRRGIHAKVEGPNGGFVLHLVEQYSRYAKALPAKTTELFRADVVQSQLSTRGWIFQEQVISPRRLHFGRHQMYWVCGQEIRAEDGTALQSSAPQWLAWLFKKFKTQHNQNPATARSSRPDFSEQAADWAYMVENYTSRSLTKASDRYVAISALAKAFDVEASPVWSQYLAGCWIQHIQLDILWVAKRTAVTGGTETPPDCSSPLQLPMIPSWSWVKARGPVEYPYLRERMSAEFGLQFTVDVHSVRLRKRLEDTLPSSPPQKHDTCTTPPIDYGEPWNPARVSIQGVDEGRSARVISNLAWLSFPVDNEGAEAAKHPSTQFSTVDRRLAHVPLIIHCVLERDVQVGPRQPVGSGYYNIPPWLRKSEDFVGDTLPLSDSAGVLIGHMVPDDDHDDDEIVNGGSEIALLTAWTSFGFCPGCQNMQPKDRHFLVLTPCPGVTARGNRKVYKRVGYGWHHCRTFEVESQHYEVRRAYDEKWRGERETIGLV